MKNDGLTPQPGRWQELKSTFIALTIENQFNKSIIGSYGLLVASVGLSLVTSIFLARSLGPAGYGDYAYAMTWLLVLSTIAQVGTDKLALRSTAAYLSKSEWSLLNGLVRWVTGNSLLASLLVATGAIVISRFLITDIDPVTLATLTIAFLMLPLLVLTRVLQGVLRGLNHILQGQVAEVFIRPFLLSVFLIVVFLFNRPLTPPQAMGLHVLAAAAGAVLGIILFVRAYPAAARGAVPQFLPRAWWAIALPFLFTGLLETLNQRADILILGSIAGTEPVGIYNVVKRLGEPALFVLISVNMALAPRISRLYASNDRLGMQALITKSTRLIVYVSFPISLFLIIAGPWLLTLWGPSFAAGYTALIIVSLGYLANAATGPVILLLNMTRHERAAMLSVGIGVIINIILNFALIPTYGINGAALATATSTVVLNLLLVYFVRKRLGIDATILGRMPAAAEDDNLPT